MSSDENFLVEASVSTVYLSHKNRDPLKAADFLSRTLHRIIYQEMSLEDALDSAALATKDAFITSKLENAKAKVKEALDVTTQLYKEEFVDDIAITSMSRLWEIGKSEPIKIGKASPTEGALPASLYIALKYKVCILLYFTLLYFTLLYFTLLHFTSLYFTSLHSKG